MKNLFRLTVAISLLIFGANLSAQEYIVGSSDEVYFGYSESGSSSTHYSISKKVEDKTFEKEFSYDVEAETQSLRVSVNGSCEKGKITITIIRPDGKTEPALLIDDNGRISLSKSYSTKNKEMKLSGAWKFKVKAENATGKYSIDVSSR